MPTTARLWLVAASLLTSASLIVFFLLAPAVGYPLEFSQSLRILEIVLPVFLGYLGAAALYVFRASSADDDVVFRPAALPLVTVLVKGPVLIFAIAAVALLVAFGITNRQNAPPGSGIGIDQLAAGMTAILGLLTVTTNVAVAYLFRGHSSTSSGPQKRKVAKQS